MTDREAKARFLLGRLDGFRDEALDQTAVDLADILTDTVRLLVPEADDREPPPEMCGRRIQNWIRTCGLEKGHGGDCLAVWLAEADKLDAQS